MPDPKEVEVNTSNPVEEDTTVVNTQEFPSNIDGFHNYRGWADDSDINHNQVPNHLREWSDIKYIVLHETSADVGKGF